MEHLDDELREISPLLRDLKRQGDGLRTPEGYFDNLENQVFGRLDTMDARRTPPLHTLAGGHRTRGFLHPRILTAIAAGIALAAAAFWFFKAPSIADQPAALAEVRMPDLSEEDIEMYVLENVQEFEAEQLAALPAVAFTDQAPERVLPDPAQHRSKRQQALDDLDPEDLDHLLDELSDQDLESLL